MIKKLGLIQPLMIILIGLSASIAYSSDTEDILNIRQWYNAINSTIQENNVYHIELKSNPEDRVFRAVGINRGTTDFYYGFGDAHVIMDEYPELELDFLEPFLFKVVVEHYIAAMHFYTEYLYNIDGELIFYYQKANNQAREVRYYFKNEEIIRSIIDGITKDSFASYEKEEANAIYEQGRQFYELFNQIISLPIY